MLPLWLGAATAPTQAASILNGAGQIATMSAEVCGESFAEIATEITPIQDGSVAWGDYDNDGDPDLLLAGSIDNTRFGGVTQIHRNDNGTFINIDAGLVGLWRSSVAWGDYNNDGDLDVLITGEDASGNPTARIYRNDNGAFTDIAAALAPVASSSVAWGDYDGDADLDILLTGETSSNGDRIARVYRNNNGNFVDIGAPLTGVAFSSVAWGNYDGDADLDILLAGRNSNDEPIAKIYRNDGGSFVDANIELSGVAWGSVAWGDYDTDGDLDILLTGSGLGFILTTKVYRNDGEGVFVDIGTALTGVADSSATWGDYDNDGDLDILIAGLSNASGGDRTTQLYRNDGNDTFTAIEAGLAGVRFAAVAWADYDNDGDLDFLLTGQESGGASVTNLYRNNRCIEVYLPAIVR
jgi:predicted nucleotidyltransferase